jgi:ubiquinone/menaquinone biosynthesis C-methylase UbiE
MKTFDHFNFISPIYDHIFGRGDAQRIVELTEVKEGQTILDAGGGTGRVALLFKALSEKIIVADSAIKMLHEAQEKGMWTVNGESEHLPFSCGAFDRIIMVDALHHVSDQQKTLDEMWRLLNHNGKFVIEEPDIQNFLVKLIALGEKLLLMRSHFLKPRTIAKMCHFGPNACVEIVRKKGLAWIIITKQTHKEQGSEG